MAIRIFIFLCFCACCQAKTVSLMTYNVENLFDSQDDPKTEDETYLPLPQKQDPEIKKRCKHLKNYKFRKDCFEMDWTDAVIRKKMKNLAEVILSAEEGQGPDILILAEVENKKILEWFNREYLKTAHYSSVQLVESDDPRGIDVAILSRFPSAENAQLIPIPIRQRTRGILRLPLQISKNRKLLVFAVHLPSQGNPTQVRQQSLFHLAEQLKKESLPWVVGGDFNITEKENKKFLLLSEYLENIATISHQIGCHKCLGTHFYKGKWSFLDMLIFDKRLKTFGVSVLNDSMKVVTLPKFTGEKGRPIRFQPDKGQGASDHYPLYVQLKVEN